MKKLNDTRGEVVVLPSSNQEKAAYWDLLMSFERVRPAGRNLAKKRMWLELWTLHPDLSSSIREKETLQFVEFVHALIGTKELVIPDTVDQKVLYWDALLGCKFITWIGSAQLGEAEYQHLGMNFHQSAVESQNYGLAKLMIMLNAHKQYLSIDHVE